MKQIWPNYSYSPTTNVLTLTGLNIDRDQLLLVTAADRGRIMYNFADSSVTASAFTSGANTALTLVATTAGLTTTAALVIYYDDQLASTTVTVSSLPAISGTVTVGNSVTIGSALDALNDYAFNYNQAWPIVYANTHGGDPLPISGTVSIGIQQSDDTDPNIKFLPIGFAQSDGGGQLDQWTGVKQTNPLPVYFPSTYPLPAGTNRIGVVTIGAGTVTIGAGTAQIGSVTVGNSITIGSCVTHGVTIANTSVTINGSITANLTYSQTAVSLSSTAATAIPIVLPTNGIYGGTLQGYNGTNTYIHSGIQAIGGTSLASATSLPVSLGSLPALVAGTAQIGSVTASISNTAVTIYPAQGTAVTNSNFTSLTSSTSLVSAVAGREVLTVFNEGAGNLYISPGATCTTISYQVRLSAGDYWECPQGQLSLAHTAVFATAGTARITEVS